MPVGRDSLVPPRTDWQSVPTCARLLIAALLLVAIPACRKSSDEAPAAAAVGYTKTIDRGPVSLTVSTDRKELSIADRLNLTLTVEHDESYQVELPAFGDKLEAFGIVDYRTTPPALVGTNRVRLARTYTLEPFLSGDYTIPAMTLRFTPASNVVADAAAKTYTLESEPFTIRVTSLLPADVAGLTLREIGPPVDLPPPDWRPVAAGAAALALILALAYGLWRRYTNRRRAAWVPPPRPAHEIAFDELRALVDRHLVEAGEVKLFYQEVSGILRRYIENRFGLRAPEQTTEEFLATLGRTDQLAPPQRTLLQHFLGHCDMVKFAEYPPTTEDIQGTFDACKNFIMETRPAPVPPTEGRHAL